MLNCVVQKSCMHGFTHTIVPAERKRNIAYTTRNICIRQVFTNPFCCQKKIERIVIVLFHSSSDGKYVRIENNVLRWETHLINQNVIRSFTDINSSLKSISLTSFIKSHYHNCGSVTFN